LQLSGKYQNAFGALIQNSIAAGELNNWFINNSTEMWDHHFEESNYKPLTAYTDISNKKFIKLATKIPLHEWDNSFLFLQQNFNTLMKLLHH
jgi:hypothetical protein